LSGRDDDARRVVKSSMNLATRVPQGTDGEAISDTPPDLLFAAQWP